MNNDDRLDEIEKSLARLRNTQKETWRLVAELNEDMGETERKLFQAADALADQSDALLTQMSRNIKRSR